MSPDDLLKCSDAELDAFAAPAPHQEIEDLFKRIWAEILPVSAGSYAGQPKTLKTAQSVSLAQAAVRIASASGDNSFLIEARHMMGRCLGANEEFERAIPFYRDVVSSLENIGDIRQAARLRLALIGVLLNADHYAEAFEVAAAAEKVFKDLSDETGLARLYNNIANIHHRTDDHARAYEYYARCYDAFRRLDDEQGIALSSFNLANALADIDEFEKSDQMYAASIKLCHKLGWADLSIQAEYNRAYLQYLRGRYSDALDAFSRLRAEFEKAGSLRHYALCDLDEAEIYLQLNLSRDAAALAIRSAGLFEKLGLKYEQAKATSLYGIAFIQLRRFSEALEIFRTSQKIFELENNHYWIGLLDLYRAEVHLSLQRFWEAQALAAQAKAVFDRLGIPSKRIFSLVLLGRVALALNDLEAASRYTGEIASIVKDIKIPLVLFPYHLLCGEIAERERKWEQARMHFESAAQELEKHQARLHHDELRVTFFKGRQKAYDALVRLSLDKDDSAAQLSIAYAWCERARSRGLIELLSHYAPSSQGHTDQSLLAKINRLREELNIQYARARPETRPLSRSSDFETIGLKEQELARTLREVSNDDPEYASLQQVSIVTLESLRASLPKRTTVIEYFTAGEEVLAFVVSPAGARVVRRLCPATRVLSQQERLGFQLEKFMLGKDYALSHAKQILEATKRHLHELHKYLIAPFIKELETPHLAIVPHGSLHFLPFHAFFDGEKYLIDDFEITYAPSASVLKYCLEKPVVENASPLLIGVADESVPLVKEELTRLKRLFPDARLLQDDSAIREAFVENSRTSEFLHIATHAVFRQDNPMFSSFKLADGWFTAFDLFSMVCQTNLVTLSGCQSGMSEVAGADDLLGLMRGFLYAGARSLLLSLWNVNDESTTELMTRFYQEWRKGAAKSTALRIAMLAVRDRYPNPFYWAPFLLAGNP
ncbi:MAG TPA: CHAT domain-containing tetratricopeptide repeat protein [Terriglobia bacterium]|jgi:CHAT domain-containing protein/tetratricopeptide (TPR) repeat protein